MVPLPGTGYFSQLRNSISSLRRRNRLKNAEKIWSPFVSKGRFVLQPPLWLWLFWLSVTREGAALSPSQERRNLATV